MGACEIGGKSVASTPSRAQQALPEDSGQEPGVERRRHPLAGELRANRFVRVPSVSSPRSLTQQHLVDPRRRRAPAPPRSARDSSSCERAKRSMECDRLLPRSRRATRGGSPSNGSASILARPSRASRSRRGASAAGAPRSGRAAPLRRLLRRSLRRSEAEVVRRRSQPFEMEVERARPRAPGVQRIVSSSSNSGGGPASTRALSRHSRHSAAESESQVMPLPTP